MANYLLDDQLRTDRSPDVKICDANLFKESEYEITASTSATLAHTKHVQETLSGALIHQSIGDGSADRQVCRPRAD